MFGPRLLHSKLRLPCHSFVAESFLLSNLLQRIPNDYRNCFYLPTHVEHADMTSFEQNSTPYLPLVPLSGRKRRKTTAKPQSANAMSWNIVDTFHPRCHPSDLILTNSHGLILIRRDFPYKQLAHLLRIEVLLQRVDGSSHLHTSLRRPACPS
ncbi:hypothetical protein BDZ45DRAFT_383126 [Acephala macrosclerotiorum]|nr:hypothetical protein BDZ45DRAFT_383126 [Acephala macrosclerotiorum]